jgi:hypothetical protein
MIAQATQHARCYTAYYIADGKPASRTDHDYKRLYADVETLINHYGPRMTLGDIRQEEAP